jgi:hypothetical protein
MKIASSLAEDPPRLSLIGSLGARHLAQYCVLVRDLWAHSFLLRTYSTYGTATMTTVIHAQSLGPPFQIYGAHARRRKTSHFQQRQSHNQSRPVREDAAVVKTALASSNYFRPSIHCLSDNLSRFSLSHSRHLP